MKIGKISRSSRGSYNFLKEKPFPSKWSRLKKLNFSSETFEEIPIFLTEADYSSKKNNIEKISSNFFFEDISTENSHLMINESSERFSCKEGDQTNIEESLQLNCDRSKQFSSEGIANLVCGEDKQFYCEKNKQLSYNGITQLNCEGRKPLNCKETQHMSFEESEQLKCENMHFNCKEITQLNCKESKLSCEESKLSCEESKKFSSKESTQLIFKKNMETNISSSKNHFSCKRKKMKNYEENKQLVCKENKQLHSDVSKQLNFERKAKKSKTEANFDIQRNQIKKETVEGFVKKVLRTDQEDTDQELPVNDKRTFVERTRRKIDCGSYPNESVNEDSLPKILRYVWKGKLKKLKTYLGNPANRANIDCVDNLGRSALHFAASWGCLKFVLFLLENGAAVNIRDSQGKTPLFKAVEIRALQCVKVLMKNGADVNIKCHDSRSAFDFAIQVYGDDEIDLIKFMYESINHVSNNLGSLTNLHKLCLAKKNVSVSKVAEMLLEKEDVNGTEGLERTPLMIAAKTKKTDLVKVLLQNNADVTLFDVNYKMAIHYCAKNTEEYNLIKDAVIMAKRTTESISQSCAKINKNESFKVKSLCINKKTFTPVESFTFF
ncbi:receptor-interacting serine/threonine-protein kinase 4 isoform X1 [Hydra vulgaris]|uniref:receptor-interacting serine/threonine-protein kinase 4 isoform X1 n=1 Tax=Hydra vulgaris TaxID=6087 RepID=UPI001F5EBD13|nr:receptor-interacting serine/threonine-protein kinase 4 [Hydra vulgaris]